MRASRHQGQRRVRLLIARRVVFRWRPAVRVGVNLPGGVPTAPATACCAMLLFLFLGLPAAAQPGSDGSRCDAAQTAENIACYEAAVRGLLQAWVTASAQGDVAAYLALYDRAPLPGDAEYGEASDAKRAEQLLTQSRRVISLDLESMAIGPDGRVDVIFKETIRTRAAETHARKQLFLDWLGAKLKIRREVFLD